MSNPQISFTQTTFQPNSFWAQKRDVVFRNTLPYQLQVLKDTGRYDAFKLKWKPVYDDPPDIWPVPNHLFWDSDVAKWMEGACYLLHDREDTELRKAIDELTEMIADAQQPDGYLNIHFTVVDPKGRWSDIRDLHELYNAGHLIEAALAHEKLTGTKKLLDPICRYVDLLCQVFGPGEEQRHAYPGHPEIELALLRLYERTQDSKHFDLAKYFLDERGNPKGQEGKHYYDWEAEKRGERPFERPLYYPKPRSYWYQQAHEPIIDQQTVEGHSVRAMYLLTAVADMVAMQPSQDSVPAYREALTRLWLNMTGKKMYLTGGIGAMQQWEGFGIDYFLPQGTDEGGCYAETCASIGVMMLAERLLQLDLDGHYADIIELCLYNAVLTAMSCDGKAFTYVNQLASSDETPSKREEWFTCACCPPNVTRLFGSLGGYFWSSEVDDSKKTVVVNVHLYGSATCKVDTGAGAVEVTQTSRWPLEGSIAFEVKNPTGHAVQLRLRIPQYAETFELSPSTTAKPDRGYVALSSDYISKNTSFSLNIPLQPRLISPHPYTNQHIHTLARGPIVYCAEDVDNDWVQDHFKSLVFDPPRGLESISEKSITDSKTGESYICLTAHDSASFLPSHIKAAPFIDTPLSSNGIKDVRPSTNGDAPFSNVKELYFVPYYFRANRGGRGQMRVGLRKA